MKNNSAQSAKMDGGVICIHKIDFVVQEMTQKKNHTHISPLKVTIGYTKSYIYTKKPNERKMP